jgi:hypothetical protein
VGLVKKKKEEKKMDKDYKKYMKRKCYWIKNNNKMKMIIWIDGCCKKVNVNF